MLLHRRNIFSHLFHCFSHTHCTLWYQPNFGSEPACMHMLNYIHITHVSDASALRMKLSKHTSVPRSKFSCWKCLGARTLTDRNSMQWSFKKTTDCLLKKLTFSATETGIKTYHNTIPKPIVFPLHSNENTVGQRAQKIYDYDHLFIPCGVPW